jgi:putative protease
MCLAAGADRVLVACEGGRPPKKDGRGTPLLPRIAHDAELTRVLECVEDTAASGNLGVMLLLAADGCAIEADWPLGVTNPWTTAWLAREGAGFVWASPELNSGQLTELVESSPAPVGMVVFGRQELMVTEHCTLQSAGPCDRSCASCERRERRWLLEDEKGYRFPVVSDARGRSHILNSRTLDLSAALEEVLATGVAAVRVDVRPEEHDPATVTAHFRSRLDAAREGVAGPVAGSRDSGEAADTRIAEDPTAGHFFRGVR